MKSNRRVLGICCFCGLLSCPLRPTAAQSYPSFAAAGATLRGGTIVVLGGVAIGAASIDGDQVGIGVVPCWVGFNGDTNCDGAINNFDVDSFLDCASGGPCNCP